MKPFFPFVLFLAASLSACAFAGATPPEDWGATNKIELSIALKDNEKPIETNENFQLLVSIKNVSTNSPFYFLSPAATYNGHPIYFEVISPSGKNIAPAPPKVEAGSAEKIIVKPNQVYKCNLNLGYLCKFNEVGTYKILAKMNVGLVQHKKQWAISDPLYVEVVSGK